MKLMLEDKDIQKLEDVFLTKKQFVEVGKEIFVTKEEFLDFREEMKNEFSKLYTAIDAYAKRADAYFQEMVMLAHKVDRHEKWIKQIAEKLGIKLEY
ncbi:MAG: hypothetical protein QME57_01135 [Patescibacteria group bacterium]|nr:hypothetical protein [Patescibacteria group bacterium]